MKLTSLGSGCSWPDPKRKPSAFLLEQENSYLVDAGEGCMRSVAKTGADWKNIHSIFITHLHNDHISGVMPYLFSLHIYAPSRDVINIYGPPGLIELFHGRKNSNETWLAKTGFEINLMELRDRDSVRPEKDMKITAYEVEHIETSLGYRVENKEKAIGFSGDSMICPGLFEIANNTDMFVCEGGNPNDSEHNIHLVYNEIGPLCQKAKVGRVILTHVNDKFDKDAILGDIRSRFSGEITISHDGQSFILD